MTERDSKLAKDAAEVIAKRAEADGEVVFANQVRAGCWDVDNRRDIRAIYDRLVSGEEVAR